MPSSFKAALNMDFGNFRLQKRETPGDTRAYLDETNQMQFPHCNPAAYMQPLGHLYFLGLTNLLFLARNRTALLTLIEADFKLDSWFLLDAHGF